MTVDEVVKKLTEIDLINNDEKCVDEDAFSSDLSYHTFKIKNVSGCITISWLTKYWDEDEEQQQLVIDQLKEVIQYWFKKLNINDAFNIYIEVCPDKCSEWDADEDGAYLSEDLIIENSEWRR